MSAAPAAEHWLSAQAAVCGALACTSRCVIARHLLLSAAMQSCERSALIAERCCASVSVLSSRVIAERCCTSVSVLSLHVVAHKCHGGVTFKGTVVGTGMRGTC
eukprot:TRINITY_DN781_c0_g1_i4.p3 TRINITY_DN781_c0_g1~~TRINITY_DN781_c0_g1_i4.p3  ORF type:complete len:104 (-),score=18.51 TRINITY_DN781_c0_g1_i4:1797-2108(-)